MSYNLNNNYGVTEVFVKHDYYSKLRIKLVRKVDDRIYLCHYKGDSIVEVEQITTDKKIYPIPENFLALKVDDSYGYIYENGKYSFFRYKYIKHEGSSRSSKSWSLDEASIRICEERPNTRFTIWRDTQTSLGDTIWKDFRQIFPLSGREYKFTRITTPIYFNNGSVIEPHGDDTTNAHGLTQYIAWLNEPYKMSEDTFNQIDMRSEQVWIDMNPTGRHWSDELNNHPRCKVIHSTFEQNPFCPLDMKLKILSYNPNNPINVANGTANEYMWQVYGLGLKAERPNRIFKDWIIAPDAVWKDLHYSSYFGLDFGLSAPSALVEMKFDGDRTFYLKQWLYKPLNLINGTLSEEFERLGVSKTLEIVCDSGNELNQSEAQKLINAGYNIIKAKKGSGSVVAGIELMQKYRIVVMQGSKELIDEYENYCWRIAKGVQLDEPDPSCDDHALDASKYVINWFGRINYLS